MMAAMLAGQRDPKVLAQLARARMRAKISQLEEAFVGRFSDHHAFLLTKMLARIDAIAADITEVETRIEEEIVPFAAAVARLDTIPGVGVTAAQVIIAEGGLDMTRVLGEAAVSAGKTDTFLGERYRRIARRRGKKKAIVAVGRSILIIVWHLLSDPEADFVDLGSGFYDTRGGPQRAIRNHVHHLEALGYQVTLHPAA